VAAALGFGHHRRVALVLGVDLGGVLLRRTAYQEHATPRGPTLTAGSEIPGAVAGLRRLSTDMFGEAIFLVSKCGPQTELRAQQWLATRGFADATGVPDANVRFCRQRADKAGICDELGITHFVDDRLEVLSYLATVEHRFLFDPDPAEVAEFAEHLAGVSVVEDWPALCDAVLATQSH
jgi:hypothetical protein